ncbi:MAG: flagellar biosynthesis protein FlhB [Clostridia bacterium]|nr:flagellar biosynthesis protein FlhB [Clostridia bacterium]
MAGEDRTEQATPRRREESRKKGQVARSAELSAALNFIVCLYVLQSSFSFASRTLASFMSASMSGLAMADLSDAASLSILGNALITVLMAAAPIVLAAMITGVAASVAQVGLLLTPQAFTPQLSRIDPLAGFGRMFSKRAVVEMLKAVAKAIVIGYFGYTGLRARMPDLVMAASMDLGEGLATAGNTAMYVGTHMAIPLLTLGAIDYAYQKIELERNLRMTKQELKEELRQQEGDPLIRSRIRQRQRQIATRRMMQDVKTADVVVTNPTHYAVAVKYDQEKMNAPRVVAKGQRLIALRIREIAQEAGVPIVENPPVAQALYHSVEIGREVPPELYRAVAEILAFVFKLAKERGASAGGANARSNPQGDTQVSGSGDGEEGSNGWLI